jgi:hypothetical protein
MNGLTDILFSPVNLPLTILLIILLLYWILTMISGLDFDLDFDVDVDVDLDVDIDVDTSFEGADINFQDISNTELDKEDVVGKRRKSLKWWQIILIYFNFVGLPFMFTFTFWIFLWWFCTTLTTSLTHTHNNIIGFIIFFASIIPSLFLTKIFTKPFKSFFKGFKQDGDSPIDLLGRIGTLQSSIKGDELTLAEIFIESKVMSVYVKSIDQKLINKTDEILLIKQSSDKNYYYVKQYTNLKN